MPYKNLNILCLTFLSMLTVACGDVGTAAIDPGPPGAGGTGGAPIEPPDPIDLIAPQDGDSESQPALDEFLSITGDRELVYSDLISAEEGDFEDFVQFELPNNSNPNQNIQVAIDCIVDGSPDGFARVDIFNVFDGDSERASGTTQVRCNEGFVPVTVDNTQTQLVRVFMGPVDGEQSLVEYVLSVEPFN